MRCHEAEALLAPQFTDGLDAATQSELALHLDSCAACRARLQQEYELDRVVRDAVNGEIPPVGELTMRIERALDHRQRWRLSPFNWKWAALAGAAAVLLCVFSLSHYVRRDPMHLLCQDAVEDHRSEVILHEPRHWHTDSRDIAELALRVVSRSEIPPTVAGMPLQEARICGLLQTSAVHLVYGSGSRQISVFLMLRQDLPPGSLPPETSANKRLHEERDQGVSVTSFADNGLGVVVVGKPGVSRDVADQLARSL